jgi:hypothetical protein
MVQKRRKLSYGLDRTKCRDIQISEHSCKDSARADLKEAFVSMSTLKRSQINDVQYPRIPSRILKGMSHKDVVDDVVAEVDMSGIILMKPKIF